MNDINDLGGTKPANKEEESRAKKVDLITLPKNIDGTNCGNCKFFKSLDKKTGLGLCQHKEVDQEVTDSMCCAKWDSKGVERDFKKTETLKKALDSKSWERVQSSHTPTAKVNHEGHIKDFSERNPEAQASHAPYVENVLHSEKTVKPLPHKDMGLAEKAIHVDPVTNYTSMIKPYFESPFDSYSKPIKGWSTLTTKDLFNSAGMGHLSEDVTGHIHNGVPVTIHKFDPNMKDMQHHILNEGWQKNAQVNANPEDVGKIAIMDFLTNNQDRHGGNIIYSGGESPQVKAIDHERLYHYNNGIGLKPSTSVANSVLHRFLPDNYQNSKDLHQNLAKWWNEHSDSIQNSFNNSLKYIKDPKIKRHIAQNFLHRHKYLTSQFDPEQNSTPVFSSHAQGVHLIPEGETK